ncbi:Glycerol uptake facilitator protein, partial [Pseudomonas syringae pv. aptata]
MPIFFRLRILSKAIFRYNSQRRSEMGFFLRRTNNEHPRLSQGAETKTKNEVSMSIALKQPTLTGQCVAEFLGTALMIFFGTGCVAALKVAGATFGLWEICIIWGMAVSMGIYLSAGISGAHLNPAVSIALSLFAGFEKRKLPFYISAQIAGA